MKLSQLEGEATSRRITGAYRWHLFPVPSLHNIYNQKKHQHLIQAGVWFWFDSKTARDI